MTYLNNKGHCDWQGVHRISWWADHVVAPGLLILSVLGIWKAVDLAVSLVKLLIK